MLIFSRKKIFVRKVGWTGGEGGSKVLSTKLDKGERGQEKIFVRGQSFEMSPKGTHQKCVIVTKNFRGGFEKSKKPITQTITHLILKKILTITRRSHI